MQTSQRNWRRREGRGWEKQSGRKEENQDMVKLQSPKEKEIPERRSGLLGGMLLKDEER